MIHIKTFENKITLGKYWLVPTDKRFIPSLKELGCDKNFINYQSKNENIFRNKYVYIGFGNNYPYDSWTWSSGTDEGKSAFEKENYRYIGSINIDPWEFDQDKYNL